MTIEEIKRNAPNGAEYYRFSNQYPDKYPLFYKIVNGEKWVWCFNDFLLSSMQDCELKPLN